MNGDSKTLKALMAIADISKQARLEFHEKLNRMLKVVVECMSAEKGSIMLVKGRKSLEVVASTNPDLVGCKQSLTEDTPSAWVVKKKEMLYMDGNSGCPAHFRKSGRYKREAFLLVPIQHKQTVTGVLCVTEKIGQDAFTKEEQTALLMIVGMMISSLENERLNQSLKLSKQTLKKKNRQLNRLEQLRTELFNMMVHDLKGPIAEVMANLDILSYMATSESKEYVEAALHGCDTLYRMIADLLDITRLEEGTIHLVQERIIPREFIKEVTARLYGQATSKVITLQEDCPDILDGTMLFGDRGLLMRVMQNLLVNAVHHAPQGSTIRIGYGVPAETDFTFFVEDEGPGIKAEYQEAIFNKYFQIQNKQGGQRGGYSTGLGLAFCKMAVEAHAGRIFVESDGVHGSRFVVRLSAEKV